jgi:pimeloyl-ACP methyl ester carboxylesterase
MNRVPEVLLLHGLWSSAREMQPVANALRRTGYRVETPEIPGYAYAAGTKMGSWRDWVQGAVIAFDTLASKHESVLVGGLCAGGMVAPAVAARKGILSPTAFFDGWGLPWLTRLRYIGHYTLFPLLLEDTGKGALWRQEPDAPTLDSSRDGAARDLGGRRRLYSADGAV